MTKQDKIEVACSLVQFVAAVYFIFSILIYQVGSPGLVVVVALGFCAALIQYCMQMTHSTHSLANVTFSMGFHLLVAGSFFFVLCGLTVHPLGWI